MNIYATIRTTGTRVKHRKLYNKFNETYNTSEAGFVGDDDKYSETQGTTPYNLDDDKYKKLLKLFNKYGFNKDIEYYIIYRKSQIVLTELNPDLTFNNYYDPIKAGDYIRTEINKDIFIKAGKEANIMLYKNKDYIIKAKSYIRFYTDPLYD